MVDFGTSTNFDVVSARGEFLGGAFAPGIEISFDALAARGRPAAQGRAGPAAVGDRQEHRRGLQSGIVYGFAGQVDGIVDRMVERAGRGPARPVIATGGLAPLVIERVPRRSPSTSR